MTGNHGGNLIQLALMAGKLPGDILDFSANINPLGLPDWIRSVISRNVSSLAHYPEPDSTSLVSAVSRRYNVSPDEILAGNGSSELLYLLVRAVRKTQAVIPVPSYIDYARAAGAAGLQMAEVPLFENGGFALDIEKVQALLSRPSIVIIGNPNNPTGHTCSADSLRRLAAANPECLFIIDEAFGDFVENFESLTEQRPANVAVLLSLTKIFAIPGLRLGCALADPGLVERVKVLQPPWSVNALAQAVGTAALHDSGYIVKSREFVSKERCALVANLRAISGLVVYPAAANFLLIRLNEAMPTAACLAKRMLLEHNIAVRVCDNFKGLGVRHVRVAVRTEWENEKLVRAFECLLGSQKISKGKKRTPAIMFQGTSSNAGKSIMTAALCRILLQDGFRIAPFKAQNMSLNSFVTRDGGEMGRAQVVQAQACRIEPDVRMNPILLKPNSDTGSQVIVMGKPVGTMDVDEYIRYKPEVFMTACRAYDELAAEYDAVILEGAGSPGEVNLKHHDIVNMGMARHAGSPVLIVGDIDRGGVFASFIGTAEVLNEDERSMLAGFIVNRFRGQQSLLDAALSYTQNHTGLPVLGVVPYLAEMNIPEEDSVTFKNGKTERTKSDNNTVEIAIIDLPHISNFTDFDAFRIEHDVYMRVVRSCDELGKPDAIIIPGSKNTLNDLAFLNRAGLSKRITELGSCGTTEIIGICGGFQMLGRTIHDPEHIESSTGKVAGLCMLNLETVMVAEKTLLRTKARHLPSGLNVQGYEIHHGKTDVSGEAVLFVRQDNEVIGATGNGGLVWGTYLHGVFDSNEFRRWLIDRLRVRRGLGAVGKVAGVYDIEPALDNLAEVVRKSIRMDEVYRLMGLR